MKNKKKNIFLLIFLIIILIFTFNAIYSETSITEIITNIKKVKIIYILICLLIMFLYFFIQSIYMKTILKSLNHKTTLKRGMFYSLVEFYFSGITPSATGGQPMQLVYMTKDKIPVRKTYITLILNTIYFKLIILILGIIVFITSFNFLLSLPTICLFFIIIGIIVDIVFIIILFLLLFKQEIIEKILKIVIKISKKLKMFKRLQNINIKETLEKYGDELNYIKNNKKIIIFTFIITFIQRLLLFSIIYVVYKSLGFSGYTYFDLLRIQISVQLASEACPLPGGAGIAEEILHKSFSSLHGLTFAGSGMFLTRAFTFYVPLLVSGFIVLLNSIKNKITLKKTK